MGQNKISDEQLMSDASSPENAKDGVATELRIAREAKKLSIADLHRLTGLSRTALHQYEAGTRKPGARELVLLCKALEVSPNRVLLGTEEPFAGANGILVPIARLAKTDPKKALAMAALMMPTVAAMLSSIGDNTLIGLATLADEALRTREPEMFDSFSRFVAEWDEASDSLVGKSKEETEQIAKDIFEKSGLMPPGAPKIFDAEK